MVEAWEKRERKKYNEESLGYFAHFEYTGNGERLRL